MMADALDLGKRTGKARVALTAFAVVAIVIWMLYLRPRRAGKPIGVIVRQIEQGDELQRMLAIRGLSSDLARPDEFALVFPHVIRAMKDESQMVREAAASVVVGVILRSDGKDSRGTVESEPTGVALCREAEEALVALLDELSPTHGCDLRLISSVTGATDIPKSGKRLIVVAVVDHLVHFRIFNGDGKAVVDMDETRLRERTPQIEILKKRLESLWPPHELTRGEKDEVITAVASVVDRSPTFRATAAKSLGFVASIGKLDVPPPRLVACLDDEAPDVRVAAAEALIEYRQGPELIVPVALRRIPTEIPYVLNAFTDEFWFVRLEPSVLPLLIEGLSSENNAVCLSCTAAINHMGRDARPALPAILTLIRKELKSPRPPGAHFRERIVAMASGAIGELMSDTDPPPGAVELLCEVLKHPGETGRASGPDRPASPVAPADTWQVRSERLAEAAWSLGILGRSAAPAVPLLLSIFDAAPESSDNLPEIITEALAEITRGTPDEDRVIASLARAWKTAPKEQKPALARALRSLGPKSEQLVPELRQMPPDKSGSAIRRVRYPRSRRGQPERESRE